MRQIHFALRSTTGLKLCIFWMASACGGTTEPAPAPKLAEYYAVVAIDGQPLPAPVMLKALEESPVPGSLVSASLVLGAFTRWDMHVSQSTGPSLYMSAMGSRGLAIIGRDSIEVYLTTGNQPTLVGRFTDTTLVLGPVGGVARTDAPVDSLEAHAWRLRPADRWAASVVAAKSDVRRPK